MRNSAPIVGETPASSETKSEEINLAFDKNLALLGFASDCAEECLFLVSADSCFSYVNRTACEKLGYTQKELLSMRIADLDVTFPAGTHPEHWESLLKSRTESRIERVLRKKNGARFLTEVRCGTLKYQGMPYTISIVRDISARKQTEEHLKLLDFALNHVKDMVFLVRADSRFVYVNQEACEKLGYTRDELLTLGATDVNPSITMKSWSRFWDHFHKVGSKRDQHIMRRKDGTTFPMEVAGSFFEYDGATYELAIVQDITERRHLELKNARLLSRHKFMTQTQQIALWYFNKSEQIFEVDDEIQQITGLRVAKNLEEAGQQILAAIDPTQRAECERNLRDFDSGKLESLKYQCRFHSPNKGWIWLKIFIVAIQRAPDGTVTEAVGYHQDITQPKETRMKSIQAEKFASLGQMAGGIAHEINNPLAIISLKAEVMLRELLSGHEKPSETRVTDLKQMIATVERIAKIVRGIRSFSRNEPLVFEKTLVASLLENTLALCSERYRSAGVKLIVSEPPALEIEASATQISQVLLNLLTNALDAIAALPEDQRWVRIEFNEPEYNRFAVAVVDGGRGIPENVAKDIMQPFFTTKETGKGTGLGLSISKGIVENHGGTLHLDQLHENTRFVLELPIRQIP
jgi:PAS domain S-box-containing protein